MFAGGGRGHAAPDKGRTCSFLISHREEGLEVAALSGVLQKKTINYSASNEKASIFI